MAFLTEAEVRKRAVVGPQVLAKADSVPQPAPPDATFDVFLSHSSSEPVQILTGIKKLLEDQGLSVYIDKEGDPQLSPESVNKATAKIIRHRMNQSKSLLYVHSSYSKKSRWMPWELGYFDGRNGRVGIVPVLAKGSDPFSGEEFLSLYPYVDKAVPKDAATEVFWINESQKRYTMLKGWVRDGAKIIAHP